MIAMPFDFKRRWIRFWMRRAGYGFSGKLAMRLATWAAPPFYGRCRLARISPMGYIAPQATIHHKKLILGNNVFIGDRVLIYQDKEGGEVTIGNKTHLYGDSTLQNGLGGKIKIGNDSHLHPGCQISAYHSSVFIGHGVQVAGNCAFYPYDHGFKSGIPIQDQPLASKGDIRVDDDAWLGYGVIVLSGVRIGKGAVVGAGSVVSHDVPDNAIAAGVPAKFIKLRH